MTRVHCTVEIIPYERTTRFVKHARADDDDHWNGNVVILTFPFLVVVHRKLSKWQLLVQPVRKVSSKCQRFRFGVVEESVVPARGRWTNKHKHPGHFSSRFLPLSSVSLNSWWRYQMEAFSASLALCAGNSPVTGEFPAQRPATWSFDIFSNLRLNKRLSKQSRGWCIGFCWPDGTKFKMTDEMVAIFKDLNTRQPHYLLSGGTAL